MTPSQPKSRSLKQAVKRLFCEVFPQHPTVSELSRALDETRDVVRGEFKTLGLSIHFALVENGQIIAVSEQPIGSRPARAPRPARVDPTEPPVAPPAPGPALPAAPLTLREKLAAEREQMLQHRPPKPKP